MSLSFEHHFDDETMSLGREYETRYGQRVAFDQLRYWVSGVQLVREGADPYEVPDAYYLVEQTPEATRLEIDITGVPVGRYEAFVFHIGVDPGPNASLDLARGELEPGIGMDWSWDTGYKFFRAEGAFADPGGEGRFVFHTGNDPLYKRLRGDFDGSLVVREDGRSSLTLRADLERLFAGLELSESPEILGGTLDSRAGQVAANAARMFSLRREGEQVDLVIDSPNLGGGDDDEIPTDGTAPRLEAHFVDLASDMVCTAVDDRPSAELRACFTPFFLDGGTSPLDAGYFTVVTGPAAPVRSASAGFVSEVLFLDHSHLTHADLFSVQVKASEDAAFFVEYRNVKDLAVSVGDTLSVGDAIGSSGDYFHPDFGAVSFAVHRRQEVHQRLCPERYDHGELIADWIQALGVSNEAWPELARSDLCAQVSVVCPSDADCSAPGDFVTAQGDIDAGRRIYSSSCASCHGPEGVGDIGPALCAGGGCGCLDCASHAQLAERIAYDMPPEGVCEGQCAADVAAFILYAFESP